MSIIKTEMLFISVIKLKIYKPNHCRTNGTRNFQLSIISSILNHETVENPLQTVFNRTQSLIIYSTKSTKESSTEILNVFRKKCIEIPICLNRVILKIPYFFKKKSLHDQCWESTWTNLINHEAYLGNQNSPLLA